MPDLLGFNPPAEPSNDVFGPPPPAAPGRCVDLSGAPASVRPPDPSLSSGPSVASGFGSTGSASASSYSSSRGPTSIEGPGGGISLSGLLNPAAIARDLATKPLSQIVSDQGRTLMNLPRVAMRAYTAVSSRYMRPWNDFARIRPARVIEGFRQASRRGEVQIYLQRNVLANTQRFLPNYMFMFLAMLFMFVCTSPMLLVMLAGVGGGWTHALRSEEFRSRPWTLAMGGIQVPVGSNGKMAILAVPTLLFLHFFMGPVLWSAALCTGGVSLAHAAIRDREDHRDGDNDRSGSSVQIRELP